MNLSRNRYIAVSIFSHTHIAAVHFFCPCINTHTNQRKASSQEGDTMSQRQSLDELQASVREQIVEKIEVQGFLTEQDIVSIWPDQTISELVSSKALGFDSRISRDTRKEMLKQRLKIISILIRIKYTRWKSFYELFINSQPKDQRVDTSLPFEKIHIESFLGRADVPDFVRYQGLFCPETIRETPELQVFKKHAKLPFLQTLSKPLGEGGGMSEKVTQECIPIGYYEDQSGRKNNVRTMMIFGVYF